jgi:hypothetical protein
MCGNVGGGGGGCVIGQMACRTAGLVKRAGKLRGEKAECRKGWSLGTNGRSKRSRKMRNNVAPGVEEDVAELDPSLTRTRQPSRARETGSGIFPCSRFDQSEGFETGGLDTLGSRSSFRGPALDKPE